MRFHELGLKTGGGLDRGQGVDAASVAEVAAQHGALAEWLVEVSLEIVHEVRGPMRLWDFAGRLKRRLGMPPVPTEKLCDAVKAALQRTDDPRLVLLAPSMPGVGYVYDAEDVDSQPVRHAYRTTVTGWLESSPPEGREMRCPMIRPPNHLAFRTSCRNCTGRLKLATRGA